MPKSMLFRIFTLVTMLLFVLVACDALEDEVNEATKQTKNFSEDLKPGIPVKGVGGACSPQGVSFDALLSGVPGWDDVKNHVSEVNINELLYTVDPNDNTGEGTVDIYITDSGDYFQDGKGTPPADDRIGSTDTIQAGQVYTNDPIQYASGGQTALEELMLDFETPFYICLGWDGNEDDVDMTFLLSVDVDVVFVPID